MHKGIYLSIYRSVCLCWEHSKPKGPKDQWVPGLGSEFFLRIEDEAGFRKRKQRDLAFPVSTQETETGPSLFPSFGLCFVQSTLRNVDSREVNQYALHEWFLFTHPPLTHPHSGPLCALPPRTHPPPPTAPPQMNLTDQLGFKDYNGKTQQTPRSATADGGCPLTKPLLSETHSVSVNTTRGLFRGLAMI